MSQTPFTPDPVSSDPPRDSGKKHRSKPHIFQWIAYAYGRKLPDSMREWVARDLVGDWALPRHLWRSIAPFFPVFALILIFVPGELWLRGAMVLLMLILGLIFSAAYMLQNRSSRLLQHGLPPTLENPRIVREREESLARYEKLYRGKNSSPAVTQEKTTDPTITPSDSPERDCVTEEFTEEPQHD